MSQQDLLARVVDALDRAGIDYMITGSVASSLQGEPRSTHDLDFVLEIVEDQVASLASAFPSPEFYLNQESARAAIQSRGMFNLIHAAEGDKVDFWLLTDQPFDRSRFARKYVEGVFGLRLKVSAPEDTILQKLRWSKLSGGSEKYFRDALGVYEVQSGRLDLAYLTLWAGRLELEQSWARLRESAERG